MAVTHFQIFSLPDPAHINSLIGINPLLIGTLYPIADQNLLKFERLPSLEGFAVSGSFTYKTYDSINDVWSNLATGFLKWKTQIPALEPSSSNVIQAMVSDQVINLLNILPLNAAVEFIQITNISGIQNFNLNGLIVIGQKISVQDLLGATFKVNQFGGGDPYAVLNYYVGKDEIPADLLGYSLTINVASIAELYFEGLEEVVNYTDEFDVLGVPTNYNVKEQRNDIKIIKGYVNGTAKLSVNIVSPFLSLNVWNCVIIEVNGVETKYFDNALVIIDVPLDTNGYGLFKITNYIVENTADPKTGSIDITLTEINGNTALVSVVNFSLNIATSY